MSYVSDMQAYTLWKYMPGEDWTALRHLIENEYLEQIDENLLQDLDMAVRELELEDKPFPETYQGLRNVLNENI